METAGTSWRLLADEPRAVIGKHSERLRMTVWGRLHRERPLQGREHGTGADWPAEGRGAHVLARRALDDGYGMPHGQAERAVVRAGRDA